MKLTRKVNKNVKSGKSNEKYKDTRTCQRDSEKHHTKKEIISKFIRNKEGSGFWRANRWKSERNIG